MTQGDGEKAAGTLGRGLFAHRDGRNAAPRRPAERSSAGEGRYEKTRMRVLWQRRRRAADLAGDFSKPYSEFVVTRPMDVMHVTEIRDLGDPQGRWASESRRPR